MAQMLAGDGIKKDTRALGIIVVNIRYAVGLSAQDSNGASDPYIVLSYAKFGKPICMCHITCPFRLLNIFARLDSHRAW